MAIFVVRRLFVESITIATANLATIAAITSVSAARFLAMAQFAEQERISVASPTSVLVLTAIKCVTMVFATPIVETLATAIPVDHRLIIVVDACNVDVLMATLATTVSVAKPATILVTLSFVAK